MLALLAINPGAVVRTDRIIEELWDDRPPTSALTTLQTYIYQLRKLLTADPGSAASGNDGRGPLQTTPGGYLLQMPLDALDVARFEELVVRGRSLFEAGQLEEASAVLRAALQEWRGPALNDIGIGPVLEAESRRLDEQRNSAIEQRIDADLALGMHVELVGELAGLVAAQPTHEGLQAKLMLVLHRSGRRSEALMVFQRARKVLAQELGLEPSRELQELHRAVLSSDPAIDSPAGRTQAWFTGAPSAVSMLPRDVGRLIGRDTCLESARSVLVQNSRSIPSTVVACGPPGIGSSAFCIRVAHDVAGSFADGQVYASMLDEHGGAVDPVVVLAHFLRTLRVPVRASSSLDELAASWSNWTADRSLLVVLDDVVSREQLAPLLPRGRRCATLLSSRRRLAAPTITMAVELQPLSDGAAVELLIESLGAARVAAELDAVDELVELCGGLPLYLRAAAARLALRPHWSVAHLMARLKVLGDPIAGLTTEGLDPASSRRRTYRLLSSGAREALDLLTGALRGPIDAAAAARVLGVDEGRAEAMLEDLVEFQLVTVEEPVSASRFHYRLRGAGGRFAVRGPLAALA